MSEKEKLVPVLVRLDRATYEAVKAISAAEDRTIAQTVRRAVKRYVAEAGPE